ncbi:MAG: hypothetical protein Q7V43_06340 [Myxococcales bacterium]|nr:hypothetical protein [Myxococcales bacterium]
MAQKRSEDTSTTVIETTPEAAPTAPPWFAEALAVLRALRVSGLWASLPDRLRVERGRAGIYVAADFVLVLLTFAVSDAPHLKAFFQQLAPVASALGALWDRAVLPSRAALSRFLGAVRPHHVTRFAAMLLDDLIDHGIPTERAGGLIDRDGQRTLVFDDDGTYHGARQRELADDATRPPPRRRARDLCARGYHGGSGRGDVTRTRTTLQQAHTHEWLGCWSAPGNGHPFAQIEDACLAVVRYLLARGLGPTQGLLRLDGLYGYARIAAAITRHGLGYLMRCADYRLFHRKVVQAVIAQAPHATYASPDSPVRRDAWQVLDLPWVAAKDPADAVVTRLIITRRPTMEKGKPRVGKRVGDHVFELFVTDRSASSWSIEDVLSVYLARGGFEATLAQEDRERDLDRTLSWSPAGQSLWTLIGQLAWNVRVRLGAALIPTALRVTLWAPASPSPERESSVAATPTEVAAVVAGVLCSPSTATATSGACARGPSKGSRGRIAAAAGRSYGRFGGSDFRWTEDGQLRCPADKLLRPTEMRREAEHLRVIYQASASDCAACALWGACRGRPVRTDRGRKVSVLHPLPLGEASSAQEESAPSAVVPARTPRPTPPAASPRPLGPKAVWWVDLAASDARRGLREALRGQAVEVAPSPLVTPRPAAPFHSRDERAHRRRTWQTCFERNRRAPDDGCLLRIHGVPTALEPMLGMPRDIPHAA